MDLKEKTILEEYKKDLERWKANNAHYRDVQPLTMQDLLYIRAVLHPTNKKESKLLTKRLIEYLTDKEICTSQDIYRDLGYSDKPVLKRLRMFQQLGLVRRESKKYYMPTPRMYEIRKRYLRRLCD